MLDLEESEKDGFVSAHIESRVFIYIEERYKEGIAEVMLQSGETISVEAANYTGKLFVAE